MWKGVGVVKFKVGDKVVVKKQLISGVDYGGFPFVDSMKEYRGKVVTIHEINSRVMAYEITEDGGEAYWTDEMLEPIEDPLVTKILERNNRPVKMISDENLLNAKITNIKLDEITGDIKTFGGDLTTDKVNSPSHYQIGEIETIDIIQTMLTPEEYVGFIKGNIIKYRERAPYKGQSEEDYKKAKKYYDILEEIENEK